MAKIVDPDETTSYEPSNLNLHCLDWCLFWAEWLKGLNMNHNTFMRALSQGSFVGLYNKITDDLDIMYKYLLNTIWSVALSSSISWIAFTKVI